MSFRYVFAAALLVVVLASRVFGLHSHIAHDEEHVAADHAHFAGMATHGERITVPVAEGTAEHLDAHLYNGEIDVDQPSSAAGKLPILQGLAPVMGLLCILLLILPARETPALQPPRRPPKPRFRPHLLPPSQGPPQAA